MRATAVAFMLAAVGGAPCRGEAQEQDAPWVQLCAGRTVLTLDDSARSRRRYDTGELIRLFWALPDTLWNSRGLERHVLAWLGGGARSSTTSLRATLGDLVLFGDPHPDLDPAMFAVGLLASSDSGRVYLVSLLDSVWGNPEPRLHWALTTTARVMVPLANPHGKLTVESVRTLGRAFCGMVDMVHIVDSLIRAEPRVSGHRPTSDSLALAIVQARLLRVLVHNGVSREGELALVGLEQAALSQRYYQLVLREYGELADRH